MYRPTHTATAARGMIHRAVAYNEHGIPLFLNNDTRATPKMDANIREQRDACAQTAIKGEETTDLAC